MKRYLTLLATREMQVKLLHIYLIDNNMVITRGKEGWVEVGEGEGKINKVGRELDLGGEHTTQYTNDVL